MSLTKSLPTSAAKQKVALCFSASLAEVCQRIRFPLESSQEDAHETTQSGGALYRPEIVWTFPRNDFGGLVVIEFAIAHLMVKALQKLKSKIKIAYVCIVIVEAVCFGVWTCVLLGQNRVSASSPEIKAKPKFRLRLVTSDLPDTIVELTNAVMLSSGHSGKIDADVVVPLKSTSVLPSLTFWLVNDSGVYADKFLVIFEWATNSLEFECASPWSRSHVRTDVPKDWPFAEVAMDIDELFPNNSVLLPPLKLMPCAGVSNRLGSPVRLQVITKERNDAFWSFFFFFDSITNVSRPHVAIATNGVFVPNDSAEKKDLEKE